MKARKRTSAASGNGRTNGRARSAAARRPAGIVDRTGDYAQAIVKSLSEAILTADDEGRFIDANEGAVALFGVSQEHLTGRGVADFTAEGKVVIGRSVVRVCHYRTIVTFTRFGDQTT